MSKKRKIVQIAFSVQGNNGDVDSDLYALSNDGIIFYWDYTDRGWVKSNTFNSELPQDEKNND